MYFIGIVWVRLVKNMDWIIKWWMDEGEIVELYDIVEL